MLAGHGYEKLIEICRWEHWPIKLHLSSREVFSTSMKSKFAWSLQAIQITKRYRDPITVFHGNSTQSRNDSRPYNFGSLIVSYKEL